MPVSPTRYDYADPDTVYLVPVTGDGRILAIAERRPGQPSFWSLPFARRRHPHAQPEPVARRILASMGLEHSGLRAVTVADPIDCQPAIYTATVAWTDRQPMLVGRGPHLLHALPADRGTLLTLHLRPRRIVTVLLDEIDTVEQTWDLATAGSR